MRKHAAVAVYRDIAHGGKTDARNRRTGLVRLMRVVPFVGPWLIGFALLTVYPFCASLLWSFTRYDLLTPPRYLGTANYRRLAEELLAGERFGQAVWNTCYYALVSVPLSIMLGIAVALLEFIAAWNDFGGPLLFLSDPLRFPLAYGLEQFQSAYGSQTNLLMAAAVLFTVPTAVLFLLAQRTFIRGIATTGLKG